MKNVENYGKTIWSNVLNGSRMYWKLSLLGFMFASVVAFAQQRSGFDKLEDLETPSQTKVPLPTVQQPGVALESTVDPEKYFVGPSDIIAVNIWISPPISFTLTVTPEGTLIIPTVGEVAVADLLLARAKEKILAEVRKKYIAGEVTATLVRPRSIVVSVNGNVLFPGRLVLNSTDRVEKAIQEANKVEISKREDVGAVQRSMSTRNIILQRKDGTVHRVDFKKYYATKDNRLNPYLREGDMIYVPSANLTKNFIGMYGEVNFPGTYEYISGDSITDAVQLAFGFTHSAISDSVELSKLDMTGSRLTTQIIDVSGIMEGKLRNIPLDPGDRIVVKAKPNLREDYRVYVGGEVVYPGFYPITKNRTKLSEVMRQAGGFTEFAWLKGAELNRHSVGPNEINLERLVSLRGGITPEDSAYYLVETDLRLQKEIVNVDFEQLFAQHDSTQDVIVKNGDYVTVPSRKRTIYVFGQVVNSGHVPYVPGENYDYYVRKAGGVTDRAREGDLKIIKAKTRQWLSPKETTVEEGDYVWVPKEPERPFSYYMNIYAQVAAIIGTVATVALLIKTLK